MKKIICILLLSFLALSRLYSQEEKRLLNGGQVVFNSQKSQCLSNADRVNIKTTLDINRQNLIFQNRYSYPAKNVAPSFGWPVRKSASAPYNETWAISYYVDHDPTLGVQDYNCGSKTYNGHQGVDIYTWPFWWEQMLLDHTEIVSAEAGQIIHKYGQSPDQNCSWDGNPWNAIYIQHSDGSVAWYGHMKKESLTSKNIGDTVVKGEYLGIIGSSGDSSGPHLHFEVYNSLGALIDPYYESCNSMNNSSQWVDQKDYLDSNINAVLTHSDVPDFKFDECAQVETTYIQNSFSLTDEVVLAVYLREQLQGTSIDLEVIRPDGTVKNNWSFNFVDDYTISYWTWTDIPDMIGEWTWKATYLGQTVTHNYTIATLGIDESILEEVKVFPNPVDDFLNIKLKDKNYSIELYDIRGRLISIKRNDSLIGGGINVNSLSKGVYFLTLKIKGEIRKTTLKFVKN